MSQPAVVPGALLGRDRELGFLEEFFRQAAVSGGGLFLSGDPGVSKTALLNVLADSASASGTMILRVVGAEFEGEISFAGLNQALLPLLDHFDVLDPTYRDALRVALGLGAGPAPDRLLVSNAALALLRAAAARVPLLLVGAIEGADHGYDATDAELVNAMWGLAMVCWLGGVLNYGNPSWR